ncbi:MAG: DUF4248 domain-containing protein [Bacteroidaceae bacterium]|nr:DUF4248 domain-containing protein [Bacteroidaceae bacterium]
MMFKPPRKKDSSPRSAYVARRVLAKHYFDSPTPHAAVDRLRRWIDSDKQLRNDLIAAGYRARQRFFNKRQVQVFVKYFGD